MNSTTPYKIGIVCHPTVGGSGVVASELAAHLGIRGHDVHVLSHRLPARLSAHLSGVTFHPVEDFQYPLFTYPPYTLALATTLGRVAQEQQLDIIHAHYAIPHAVSAYLVKQMLPQLNVKVITTLHGTDITLVGQLSSMKTLTKFAIEQSDAVTAVSDYLAQETCRTFALKKDVKVIPNFVNIDRFKPEALNDQCLDIPKDRKIITHVSNFRPVKRVGDVVETFDRIQKANDQALLLLVGEGPDLSLAQQMVKERNLDDKVRFLGTIECVESVLARSHLFLLPSAHESFGLSAIEAMACGVPVVTTAGSGMDGFVTHPRWGRRLPVGDTDAMAKAALELLSEFNDDDAAALSEFVSQEYNACEGTERYLKLYEEVMSQ